MYVDANKYKATNESTGEGNDGIGGHLTRDLQGQRTGIPRQRAKNPEDSVRQEAMVCREKLKELTSMTYNTENLDGLKELNTSLELLVNKFTKYQTTDEKENFLQTLLNKQVKSNGQSSAGNYLPLPVRSKKNRYKNRVGAFTSMMQKHYKVNVPVNGASSVSNKIQTKKNLKRKNKSGLKYSTPAKKQRGDWGPPAQNVPTLNSETSSSNGINDAPIPVPTENSKPQSAPQKQAALNESGESAKENKEKHNCNSPCDPIIPSSKSPVIVINDDSSDPPFWVKLENCNPDNPESKLILYEASKSSILNKTSWLTDSKVHAGQLVLKKEFPFLDGLNDTTITRSQVVPARSDFVQIVNTGPHWVCLRTIGTRPAGGTVKIFDSLYLKPSSTGIKHARRMLMFPGNQVTLVNEKVQRPVGINDCGLFALAFATDLCHGLDPVNQKYKQESMRQHYVSCLENGAIVPFPKTTRKFPSHISSNKSSVAIYCVCRMPYDKEEYVQCSYRCKAWYHTSCVNIPEWAINSGRKLKCGKCKEPTKY